MKGEEFTFSLKKGEVESVKENHFKLDATHAQIVWYHITAQPSPAQPSTSDYSACRSRLPGSATGCAMPGTNRALLPVLTPVCKEQKQEFASRKLSGLGYRDGWKIRHTVAHERDMAY